MVGNVRYAMLASRKGSTLSSTPRIWLAPALALTLVGWGANQFASMLVFYQEAYGFSQLNVTSMLGIYVAGLLPALLLGGRVSDRLGRKNATVVALLITMVASLAMIGGINSALMIYVGRLLAGVATGAAMAAGTSWVKELSQGPWDRQASAGAGARRASLYSTGGFWLGPVASGLLANFAPLPDVLPYAVHILLCIPLFVILLRLPETRQAAVSGSGSAASNDRGAYPGAMRRFWRIVGPGAPWVFSTGTIGFAVVPALMLSLGERHLLYSTTAVALTLGFGVAVQPLARKLDSLRSARASLVALLMTLSGLFIALGAGWGQVPWLGLLASSLLGAGYGLMLVAGLLETQRLSSAEHLGAATGKFYTLAYAGYLTPTVMAFFALWFNYLALLGVITLLGVVSLAVIAANSRSYLPPGAGRQAGTREDASSKAE